MKIAANTLSVQQLTAGYQNKPVLDEVELTVRPGEICCVIGEEGAGKSTLVKGITRQIRSTGHMYFGNLNLASLSTSNMTINGIDFIAQGGNILNGFTVEEHIQLAMATRPGLQNKKEIWEEISSRFPRMVQYKHQTGGRLSGGERMILSMACVLATDAQLLILDEPTAGLAPGTCDLIGQFLQYLQHERQKTILITEHNYDFAFEIADSIITLKERKLSEKHHGESFRQSNFLDLKLYELPA